MKFAVASVAALAVANAAQPTVKLNNGVEMPAVSLGVWKYNNSYAHDAVASALELGYNAIDTAYDYANQDGVGNAVKEFLARGAVTRKDLFITTKIPACGTIPIAGLPTPSKENCKDDSTKLLNQDLAELQMDYVDLMLLHFPPNSCGGPLYKDACTYMKEQWSAMEEFYKAGKARSIGVSNYCQSCFECILAEATVVPQVNQVQYHVGEGPDPIGLKTYADEKGIVMEAYSAMAQGSSELISGNLTTSIGQKYAKSGAQVSLKWIVQHGWTLTTKAANPKYQAEDIDLFDFTLSDEDMAALDASVVPKGSPSFFCSK
jgi:diketogulonate reductase-like aldo/keto reductase